jgi:hypothetical protein
MPTLAKHPRTELVKALYYGDSGSGKTGSLAALANLGHRLIIKDYDNGLEVLRSFVKSECMENVNYVTLTDKLKGTPMGVVPVGMPTALTKGLRLLDNWKDGDVNLGPISSWGRDTTFVCDSLSFMGQAAIRFIRAVNGRAPDDASWISDWGEAMKLQEGMLELLYSDAVQCNVIVTAHIIQLGGDPKTGEGSKGFPAALGAKLPPRVPRYFNNTFRALTVGGDRRVIRTTSTEELELKSTNPKELKKEYPIATGLAEIYKAITGEKVQAYASRNLH